MNKAVQRVFSQVPKTYELVNHLLTFSLDVRWRKKAAKYAPMRGGTRWIDVCTGTGEMAAYLQRLAVDGALVYATDFSLPMLSEALTKPEARQIRFLMSDVSELPFDDDTFDVLTISFATRNLNANRDALIRCFKEFRRVLKPRGCLVHLETSQPSSRIVKSLFHLYVRLFVRSFGTLVSGSSAGYAYLAATIQRFYTAEELVQVLRTAGFGWGVYHKLFLGIAAIHLALADGTETVSPTC